MWKDIAEWMVENHGLFGVFVVCLVAAIVSLATALVFVFKKYTVAMKELTGQAERCRTCLMQVDERHDRAISGLYDRMRSDNNETWEKVERVLNRVCDATNGLSNIISNLSGRLNGMGGK